MLFRAMSGAEDGVALDELKDVMRGDRISQRERLRVISKPDLRVSCPLRSS